MKRFLFLSLLFPSLLFSQMKSPSCFIENVGQIKSITTNTTSTQRSIPEIRFILHGNGLTYYFSDQGYSIVQQGENGMSNRTDFFFFNGEKYEPVGLEQKNNKANYISPTGNFSANEFEKITYRNLWNGCDLEFSIHNNFLERKLIVRDPNYFYTVLFDVNGSSVYPIQSDSIVGYTFTSPVGTISEKVVQPSNFIVTNVRDHSEWSLDEIKAQYTFHPRRGNLQQTTSSTISWLTYIGGNSADEFFGIQLTNDSGAVVVGRTGSLDFPSSVGSLQDTMAGNYDAVIVRFASNGTCLWSTYYGGTNFDGAYQVVQIDSSFVICGMTNSTDLPVMNATQANNAGSYDAFLLVLDSAGNELRSTYYGGTGGDQGLAVAKGPGNEIVLAGSSSSTDLPLAAAGYQPALAGQIDAFLAVFNMNLTAQWSTYYGGTLAEDIHALCVTPQGEIAFVGGTRSNDFHVTANAWQNGLMNQPDNYLVKFGMNGTLHYATFFGGTNNEDANGIVSDNVGNLYMTGFTYSADFPIQGTSFQSIISGQNDVYVSKFDTLGQLVWSTFVGGSGQDVGWGMFGRGKYIYICGETASPNFPVSSNAIQATYSANSDGFVIKMDTTGQMVSGTFMGGSGYDGLLALTVDADTNVIAVGDSYSTNLAVTPNAFQMTNHFNGDGYVVKFGMAEQLVSTSVIAVNENSSISIFPNPSSDFVTVSTHGKTINKVEITDAQGRLVKSVVVNSTETKIEVRDLAKGIYFLKVMENNSGSEVFRLVRN